MDALDQVRLSFDPASLRALNLILGLVMLGVALDLAPADFLRVLRQPRAVLIGLFGQLIALPALTFALILAVEPAPSVALGMLLVASCPGGNVSNLLTHLGRGNTSLSITMTAFTTSMAVVTTPLNLAVYGGLYAPAAGLLREIALDPLDLVGTIALLLGVPLIVGMTIAARLPRLAARLRRPARWFSVIALAGFIVAALAKNFPAVRDHLPGVLGVVALHNALAFAIGDVLARLGRLGLADRRALTVEVGIQNSGLALILIFGFFGGLGGMAVIAAAWGVWHLLAGLTLVAVWSRLPGFAGLRRDLPGLEEEPSEKTFVD